MSFEEILDQEGILVYKTMGISMLPMLHQNRDLVVIRSLCTRPEKYDVVLYKRGPKYILHRIIKVRENDFLIRGDNTYYMETVPSDRILGILTKFVRNGREIPVSSRGYRLYVRLWCALYPLRRAAYPVALPLLRRAKRIVQRLFHSRG